MPDEVKVYAGPIIAVGAVQAPKKLIRNNPKIIFLLITMGIILIHLIIQLKVEFKIYILIYEFNVIKQSNVSINRL